MKHLKWKLVLIPCFLIGFHKVASLTELGQINMHVPRGEISFKLQTPHISVGTQVTRTPCELFPPPLLLQNNLAAPSFYFAQVIYSVPPALLDMTREEGKMQ